MTGTFDFAVNHRVIEELPPEEHKGTDLNGWVFNTKPSVPYRPTFKVTLHGMRWFLNTPGNALDIVTQPTINAGRLRKFYLDNRQWDSFTFVHEFLGTMQCRFADPVVIPAALPNSGGLIAPLEVTLIQHNPGF